MGASVSNSGETAATATSDSTWSWLLTDSIWDMQIDAETHREEVDTSQIETRHGDHIYTMA